MSVDDNSRTDLAYQQATLAASQLLLSVLWSSAKVNRTQRPDGHSYGAQYGSVSFFNMHYRCTHTPESGWMIRERGCGKSLAFTSSPSVFASLLAQCGRCAAPVNGEHAQLANDDDSNKGAVCRQACFRCPPFESRLKCYCFLIAFSNESQTSRTARWLEPGIRLGPRWNDPWNEVWNFRLDENAAAAARSDGKVFGFKRRVVGTYLNHFYFKIILILYDN